MYSVVGRVGIFFAGVAMFTQTALAAMVPVKLSTFSFQNKTNPWGVQVVGQHALVNLSSSRELKVLNVSNPSYPTEVATLDLSAEAGLLAGMEVKGGYAYITDGGSKMLIVNIQDPGNPVFVKSHALVGTGAHELVISGSLAYVIRGNANTYFDIVDISDPENPVNISTTNIQAYPQQIVVKQNKAYIVGNYDNGKTKLYIYDVLNSLSPSLLSATNTGKGGYGLAVSAGRAYVSNYAQDNIIVFNIADAYNPVLLSATGTQNGPGKLMVNGDSLYALNSPANTLEVFDISKPNKIKSIGSVRTAKYPFSMDYRDGNLYITNWTADKMQIFQAQ